MPGLLPHNLQLWPIGSAIMLRKLNQPMQQNAFNDKEADEPHDTCDNT